MNSNVSKFENFNSEDLKLETSKMSNLKGGTTSTTYTVIGYAENEQEIDKDGRNVGKPHTVYF